MGLCMCGKYVFEMHLIRNTPLTHVHRYSLSTNL